jgi:hypothetical protein
MASVYRGMTSGDLSFISISYLCFFISYLCFFISSHLYKAIVDVDVWGGCCPGV